MKQSLSITLVLEGGLPVAYLSIQDNYSSPAQILNVPLEFVDFGALVNSAQHSGDFWVITASPDHPRFQVETAVFVRHHAGTISWELVYEHYESFLNIELSPEADDYDENIITFVFEPFQYVSVLRQLCLAAPHLLPSIFSLETDQDTPLQTLQQHLPRLNILWQKYGIPKHWVENGEPTQHHDHFALEAEKQWLQDLVDTLDAAHDDEVLANLDAYLESLPEEALTHMENNRGQLYDVLLRRWETLLNSLTEEEAAALEK
ncbi:MAG: hypothetical protein R3E89_01590 [Thiolinea sp.]